MTREEAISEWTFRSNHIKKWLDEYGEEPSIRHYVELIDMAIEALSANATVAKIQIDDIDKAKTSSQLLDDLAVDLVNAMGKRIVEVVYCRDCRHFTHYADGCGVCAEKDHILTYQNQNDFCSYGERREK